MIGQRTMIPGRCAIRVCALCLAALLLGGCAAMQSVPPEQALRQRVDTLMQATVDEDLETIYAIYDQGFRDEISFKDFLRRNRPLDTLGYSIKSIEIAPDGQSAKVHVDREVRAFGFKFNRVFWKQTWLVQGGEWYVDVDPKPRLPF